MKRLLLILGVWASMARAEQDAGIVVFDQLYLGGVVAFVHRCGEVTESPVDFCAPDPYDRFCEADASGQGPNYTPLGQKSNDEVEETLREFDTTEEMAALEKAYGQDLYEWPKHNKLKRESPEFRAKLAALEQKRQKVISERIEARRPEVEKNVLAAYNTFLKVMEDSAAIDPLRRKFLRSHLKKCFFKGEKPNIAHQDGFHYNAAMNQEHDLDGLFTPGMSEQGIKLNGLDDASTCRLDLTSLTWIHCANGSPLCFQTLFHELGHMLNTCFIKQKIRLYVGRRDAEIDPTKHGAYQQKIDWLKEMETSLTPPTSAGRAVAGNCLDQISSPKRPVLNQCVQGYWDAALAKEEDASYVKECGGEYALNGHPSQLDEAQADLWSASMVAEHFKGRPDGEKKRFLNDMFIHACRNSTGRLYGAETSNRREKWKAYGTSAGEGEFGPPETAPAPAVEPAACTKTPWPGQMSVAAEKSLTDWDSHQEDGVRLNRNYLRNLDLRRALGCRLDAHVPLACSPKGRIGTVLPR